MLIVRRPKLYDTLSGIITHIGGRPVHKLVNIKIKNIYGIIIHVFLIFFFLFYVKFIGIEDFQGNRIVDQRQVLKIWENYITELYDRPNRPEAVEVEPEEEVDTDEKEPHILQSEVEKVIKEMRNRKFTGDDDIPGDVLKLLEEGGLKILKKLSNTIYNTESGPRTSQKLQWLR